MDLEKLKARKQELGYTNKKISEETGIALGTVQKIFAGVTKTPRWDKIEAIEALLGGRSAGEYAVDDRDPSGGTDPKQGNYTIEDYFKLPDERRVELIDGFIYDMASPSLLHPISLMCMCPPSTRSTSESPPSSFAVRKASPCVRTTTASHPSSALSSEASSFSAS